MGHSKIKLRISDDALADMAQHHDWTTWRETIEAAGIDVPELEQLRAENERLKAEFTKLKAACEMAASWNQFFGVKVGAERKAEQDELDQLRGLLLSGQCVDLLCGILADSSGLPSSAGRKVVPHE